LVSLMSNTEAGGRHDDAATDGRPADRSVCDTFRRERVP
jgi:hypothetical protein